MGLGYTRVLATLPRLLADSERGPKLSLGSDVETTAVQLGAELQVFVGLAQVAGFAAAGESKLQGEYEGYELPRPAE